MADIIPFKGTRYNIDQINDLSKVTAPPYDVISPEEQDKLYNADPHNIIRILLGKALPEDNPKENKYTRAARYLKDWQEKGTLRRDEDSSVYIYLQEFTIDGQIKRRLGFIALLRLEDFHLKASVYPHEDTFSAPKEDRTRLIKSIEANLGPIFALFADGDKAIDAILVQETKAQPIIDIIDRQRVKHKLWRASDKDTVDKVVRLMKDKKIFIADGHHRYEAGLAFSKIKKDPKYGYILAYFTDVYGKGIVILPLHRLIAGVNKDILSSLRKDLNKDFAAEEVGSKEHVKAFLSGATPSEKRFVMYDGHRFTGLRLNDKDSLDVSALHNLIIGPLDKRVSSLGGRISIDFTKDLDYAINEVDSGRFSLSIMLNPTNVTQVRDMAFSGRRMPQKSTYFYPKVLTGLVINVF